MIRKFEFDLTFAPEPKLQGEKLNKVIDDYHNYAPGTTKQIKSKPERTDEELEAVDSPSEKRYEVNTHIRRK